ncbi:galactose oxidase [Rhizophagus irregularis]|uniref:Galactose oxidase n=1 Tax=Rhizophagus irregularis TaxID=588596 RepID=A0A2N0S0D5_9GLOM|nr:galactose oxidase [Rhizophagus irregularis]
MSRNPSVYFMLWILLQILVKVNCQMTPFKPSVYYRHTATLIDNKLYILGGLDFNDKPLKEFFYLDVSIPFNTQELSWQDLSNINMVPVHVAATSVKGGPNNDTLFLYGGASTDQTMALVYTFDSHSIVWSIPKVTGINPIGKWEVTGIINNNGRMYLWSGKANTGYVNEMLILDTINLSLSLGSLFNAPTPRVNYGAILLPNNKIIYIGGNNDYYITTYNPNTLNIDKGTALTLSEIYIYDTINDNWDTRVTLGKIPSNRGGLSAVLGLDGQRIIIYGGFFINPGYLDTTLYVLDLNNYNWYIPKISGKIPNPRAFHKANVIGKYMVISFGDGYDKTVESDILLLDISNNKEYIWTTIFDPKMPSPPPPPPPPPPSTLPPLPPPSLPPSPSPSSSLSSSSPPNNSGNIAGIVVGSLLSSILLSVGSFLIYKWNKNKQKTIHENNNNNDYSQEEKELPIIRDIHNYEQDINNNEQEAIQINQIPRNESTSNYEPIIIPPPIINKNNNHKQEIILTPENENTTNHEPIIIPVNDHHGQEIMQTLQNENTSDHEPAPAVVNTNNYNYGQEVNPNNNRISSQLLKDEILQAIKQEIGHNLKNEILQAVREENFNNKK